MGGLAAPGPAAAALITSGTASVQRIRDFLSVAWPVMPEACAQPFLSKTWLAALHVVAARCDGQPERLAELGIEAFAGLVRSALPGWGGQRIRGPIIAKVFTTLTSTEGVVAGHRRGLLRRIAAEMDDLRRTRAQQRDTEAAMTAALGALGLARLGDIPGLTATGAAAILAEAGDPGRYETSSSLVRHAGMSPSDNASGAFDGEAHISRRGRPSLRLTAWRAVWPMPSPLALRRARSPGHTVTARRPSRKHARPGGRQHAQPPPRRQPQQHPARPAPPNKINNGNPRHRLTNILLRWCRRDSRWQVIARGPDRDRTHLARARGLRADTLPCRA